ncbi:sulfatase-like hydrolase/transferase [bacterium]|nr:sulfatase-like hydrolase/transferase [bacterium]
MKNSADSRYFLTIFYIFMLFYKVLLSGQYLYSVPDHHPILFFPPLSVIFAATDFILLFMFFKICDFFSKFKWFGFVYLVVFLSLGAFYLYDFSIFQYFRGFTDFGLNQFLVYDSGELSSYFIFSLNPFLAAIILTYLFSFLLLLLFAVKKKSYLIRPFSDKTVRVLLGLNILFFFIPVFLPFEEKVGLEKSPVFEYFSTRILSSYYLDVNKKVEKVEYPKIADEDENFPKIDFDYSQTKGKNVIFVILESTAFERTPLGGDKESKFSFLDDLSEKSISFVSHRTVFPATTRSLLSLFCSNIPGTGYASITKSEISYDCDSIFDAFRKSGYSTSFFSPVLLDFDNFGNAEPLNRIDYIFEPSQIIASGTFKRKFGTTTAIEEEIVQEYFFKHIQELWSENKPFFALYFPYWTHAPYEVPFEDTSKLGSLERYYKSQEYVNKKMEEFLETLEKENILENSIVVFTSDHGEGFGRKVGNFIHPNYLWDENLHVPFMIYAKGITDTESKTVTNPTTVLDVAPTMAALAGIEPEKSWTGNNMFEGKTDPVFIYTRAMNLHSGILDGNRKFFFNHVTGENYCFDLKNDPLENNDLADTLDDNKLKQLRNYIEYKNFELNDKAVNQNKTK